MADRGDPWDSRASYGLDEGRGQSHTRADSTASTFVGAPLQKEGYGYDTYPPRVPEPQNTDKQFTGQPHLGGY